MTKPAGYGAGVVRVLAELVIHPGARTAKEWAEASELSVGRCRDILNDLTRRGAAEKIGHCPAVWHFLDRDAAAEAMRDLLDSPTAVSSPHGKHTD